MTQTGALVLGLAAQKPTGPYDMLKTLEKVNIRRWYQVSDASIYLAVKKLEKEGLLQGTPVREGNNPEKTVYAITAEGGKALQDTIRSYLESPDAPREAIDIAILFLCHLPKETALELVDRRIGALEAEIDRAETLSCKMRGNPGMPFIGRLMVRHNLLEKQALLTLFRELRAEAAAAPRWDYFVARGNE